MLGKGKFLPVLDQVPRHEDVLGSGGMSPRIRNFGTDEGEYEDTFVFLTFEGPGECSLPFGSKYFDFPLED
jgi:hypothetical protein